MVLIGTPAEGGLLRDIAAKAESLGGRAVRTLVLDDVDLPTLIGVLASSDIVVGNDSGIRHLAQAVGTATVGIYWIRNALNAGPLSRSQHRMLISWTARCQVCGHDYTMPETPWCGHDLSLVADISVDQVIHEVDDRPATRLARKTGVQLR